MKITRIRQFDNAFHRRIGKRLQELRDAAELSRQTVSTQTGIPVTMITQYERDGVLPPEDRLEKMLCLYGGGTFSRDEFLRSVEIPTWGLILGEIENAE